MDFALSEDHLLIKDNVRSFMARECPIEYVRKCDDDAAFPHELYGKIAKLGWLGMPIPEAYGGSGGSCMDLVMFLGGNGSAFRGGR